MKIQSLKNSFSEIDKIHFLIILLISLAFLVSDWMIGLIAISEIIMVIILLIIIAADNNSIRTINYKFLTLILTFFVIQFAYNMSVDMVFVFLRGLYNVIKIFFYLIFINVVFNYLKKNSLEKNLLALLNVTSVIAIFAGVYITLAILFFENLPYEFMWTFTRSDLHSYRFRGPGFIVRTRSVFSEPAHLGYFLNIVLSVNLFSKYRERVPLWLNSIIVLGISLTLSYASIGVMGATLLIKLLLLDNKRGRLANNYLIIIITLFIGSVLLFLFWDYFYHTIILRTSEIISGVDNSAYTRLVNSWNYISRDSLLLGRGLGHTPPLQNIYAYYLSDGGIIPFAASILFTFYLVKNNIGIGLTFILLNFQKGGYLSPVFNLYILIILIFVYDKDVITSFLHRKDK